MEIKIMNNEKEEILEVIKELHEDLYEPRYSPGYCGTDRRSLVARLDDALVKIINILEPKKENENG